MTKFKPNKSSGLLTVWFISLLTAFFCHACDGESGNGSFISGDAEWTVLMYMVADNNLEESGMRDLREIVSASAGSSKANFVALVDRNRKEEKDNYFPSDNYSSSDVGGISDWSTAKIIEIRNGYALEVMDLGEVNTGVALQFEEFLNLGIRNYPADKYYVILWDHGLSWPGFGGDEENSFDYLSVPEMAAAFSGALNQNEMEKFDVIGFDACLMGNLEVAYGLADFADYFIASQSMEPDHGWAYDVIYNSLKSGSLISAKEVAELTVSSYVEEARQYSTQDVITLAAIDLNMMDSLGEAVSEFADILNEDFAQNGQVENVSWKAVGAGKAQAENYGSMEGADVIDLKQFIQLVMENLSGNVDVLSAGQIAVDILDSIVISSYAGFTQPHANGLSVFFPSSKEVFSSEYFTSDYKSLSISKDLEWDEFLSGYYDIILSDIINPSILNLETTHERILVSQLDEATISAKIPDADIAEVNAFLGSYEEIEGMSFLYILGLLPVSRMEDGAVSTFWDGSWPKLVSGDESGGIGLTIMSEEISPGVYLTFIPATYYPPNSILGMEVELRFLYDYLNVESEYLDAWGFLPIDNVFLPVEIEFEAGGRIYTNYLVVDENNETYFIEGSTPIILADPPELTLEIYYLVSGEYDIGFMASDFADNIAIESLSIELVLD